MFWPERISNDINDEDLAEYFIGNIVSVISPSRHGMTYQDNDTLGYVLNITYIATGQSRDLLSDMHLLIDAYTHSKTVDASNDDFTFIQGLKLSQ